MNPVVEAICRSWRLPASQCSAATHPRASGAAAEHCEAEDGPVRPAGIRFCSCLFVVLLLTALNVSAAVFEDANRLYEQGKYAEAIPLYQNLLKSGHRSPGVLFNLGNAHFKNGELGRAIYHYRVAQQIAPRDPDIQANLRFARERVSGSISIQPSLAERLLRRITLDEVAGATALFLWIFLGLLSLGRWRPTLRQSLRPLAIAIAALLAASAAILAAAWSAASHAVAVITVPQAVVRLGPLAESQTAYTANDGAELRVLSRRDDWIQVSDRSNRSGWLDSADCLIVGE